MRDRELEGALQQALDAGHNVWVVGDVHGFYQTMVELCARLDLSENDWVVFLGDLVDRGPNAFGVVHHVMSSNRMATVKGNHEDMMVRQFTMGKMRTPDLDVRLWMKNGGNTTVKSYLRAHQSIEGKLDESALEACAQRHTTWMSELPTHIVLDRWRLVHAGYRPGVDAEEQSTDDLLWIRREFHTSRVPIDPQRTVVFGHTITAGLPGRTMEDWGRPWESTVMLEDERPSAIGLDTCLYHGPEHKRLLTAMNLQTGQSVQQARVEV